MRISIKDREIAYYDNNRVVCFENDNDMVEFICNVEDGIPTFENWQYKLDIEANVNGNIFYNTVSLKQQDKNVYGVLLQAGMMPKGKCLCQIRRISNNKTMVSERFEVWVKKSILGFCTAYQEKNFIPSEFYQIEQNLITINNNPPIPDATGFWRVWDNEIRDYVISDIPVIGQTIYDEGNGIEITDDKISIKADNKTVAFNDNNELYVSAVDGGYI